MTIIANSTNATVVPCLRQWGAHDHPTLASPDPKPGNCLLLFFRVDDFHSALTRARTLLDTLADESKLNGAQGSW